MSLFRNKEVKWMSFLLLLIAVTATAVSFVFSPVAAFVTALACLSMVAVFLLFTHWRYQQMIDLNAYLKRVNDGDYALELRDNDEGELSILKSEIYKVTMTLRQQNESLHKEKKALVNSLSDISHQLKTPLTSMFMMTDLLCGDQLTEEKRVEFTHCIRQQLERLQWLVESLLKISKLDAETVAFKYQKMRPGELIEKACAPLNIPMELKNQTLSVQTDDLAFCCDFNWTAEALINILKNCIEYSPLGGEIRISAFTNSLFTQISIMDNGPGIDKSDLPNIFKRFYKGKNAGADSVGIGLAMAKTIIEAQDGSIEVKSEQGNGTIFTLRFPKQMGE